MSFLINTDSNLGNIYRKRLWDNGRRNIKLIRLNLLKCVLHLMLLFEELGKALTFSLVGWLVGTQTKRWSPVSKLEIPDLPWFHVEEEIQTLRADLSFKTYSSHLESPEDISFTTTMKNTFVIKAMASLKSSVITFHCRPDLTMGTTVTKLGNVNAMGVMRSWDGRS